MEHAPSRLAKEHLAFELLASEDIPLALAAGRACEKIFKVFGPVIGAAGVRALFGRSIRRAKAGLPGLELIASKSPLEGTDRELERVLVSDLSPLSSAGAETRAVALYEAFFELTISLIGEALVVQIMASALAASHDACAEDGE